MNQLMLALEYAKERRLYFYRQNDARLCLFWIQNTLWLQKEIDAHIAERAFLRRIHRSDF